MMNCPNRHRISVVFLAVICLLAGSARGQNSLVALGEVTNSSFLVNSFSPSGASIAVSEVATGSRNITVTSAGAFAGASESDFVILVADTVWTISDTALAATVISVTPDVLTVRVKSMDVEVANPADLAVATNANFSFAIHRMDGFENGKPFESPQLLAVGSVNLNGVLQSGFGVNGHSIITGRSELGYYFINVVKPGTMVADSPSQYGIMLSTTSNALPDVGIRGTSFHALSDDFVNFKVSCSDVQNATPSNGAYAADAPFAFAIYRLAPADSGPAPQSNLLAAIASVDGTNGSLVSAKAGFPGVAISSLRVSEGFYRIFFDAPGAFAGVNAARYVPLVAMNSSNQIDEIVKAKTIVVNDNRMRVDITVDDVQHNGDPDGIPADGSFFLMLYDTAPVLQQDLSLGVKPSGAGARGSGIVNASGAGQTQNLTLKGKKPRAVYYRASQSGQSIDSMRLRTVGMSPKLLAQFYVTTGARRNVTALTKTGAIVEAGILPGDSLRMQASVRYKSTKKRRNALFALRSISEYNPAGFDTTFVKTKPK